MPAPVLVIPPGVAAPLVMGTLTVRSAPPPPTVNVRVTAPAVLLSSTAMVPVVPAPPVPSAIEDAAVPVVVTLPSSTKRLPRAPAAPRYKFTRLPLSVSPPLPTVSVVWVVPLLP